MEFLRKSFGLLVEVCDLFRTKLVTHDSDKNLDNTPLDNQQKEVDLFRLIMSSNRNYPKTVPYINDLVDFNKKVEDEVRIFIKILKEKTDWKEIKTEEFWIKYRKEMPILFKLAVILKNISCSSAAIERYFSLAGVVCKTRCTNMKEDLSCHASYACC